MSNSKMF